MVLVEWIKCKYRRYQADTFEKTKYGQNLTKFKDIHKGKRCFVIGNGPSLTAEDLTLLHNNNEITFASNKIFHIFDKTPWRPKYYASEDEIIVTAIQKEIEKLEVEAKFIPIVLNWYHDVDIEGAEYYQLENDLSRVVDEYMVSDDITKKIVCKGTVTATLMQIAFYMGFTEIYLIGIDHSYRITTDNDGKVVENEDVIDYFSDSYEDGLRENLVHNLELTTKSYKDIKLYADKNNIKIFNATRGGKLEVYPRKSLEEILLEKI